MIVTLRQIRKERLLGPMFLIDCGLAAAHMTAE
jgi:hypothetical protein